jgi:hypothetical protein
VEMVLHSQERIKRGRKKSPREEDDCCVWSSLPCKYVLDSDQDECADVAGKRHKEKPRSMPTEMKYRFSRSA